MNKIQSHNSTNEYLPVNSEISVSNNIVCFPFKGLVTEQSAGDNVYKGNDDLNEMHQMNIKQLSDKSSVGSFQNITNSNLPQFKNYDYNFTEQVGVNEEFFGPQITETSESTETDLNTAHLIQTLQGIQFIRQLEYEDVRDNSKCVLLPP